MFYKKIYIKFLEIVINEECMTKTDKKEPTHKVYKYSQLKRMYYHVCFVWHSIKYYSKSNWKNLNSDNIGLFGEDRVRKYNIYRLYGLLGLFLFKVHTIFNINK